MREILFRGQNPRSKEWIYGYFNGRENSFARIIDLYGITRLVNPETVGQYTGMTDKNGNKIFEGDIVKVGNALVRGIFAVEYSGMGACFIVSCGESRYFLGGCSSEVIGNIHD